MIVQKKKPRALELNNNLVKFNESNFEYVGYPATFEGLIKSMDDRFTLQDVDKIWNEWLPTCAHFKA